MAKHRDPNNTRATTPLNYIPKHSKAETTPLDNRDVNKTRVIENGLRPQRWLKKGN